MPTTSKVSSSSKTKAVSKPATISKQFKSAELIEDSDDEDEENRGRTPRKPVKISIAIESKPKPPKIKPKALPVSVKSSPAIPNGKASSKGNRDSRSSVIISSSDGQAEDEESGTEETEVKNVEVDEDSEDEESGEGSSSGCENGTDSSSGDDERKSYDGVPQSKKTAPSTQQKQATSRKPVPQYELPSGFESATITIPTSSNLTDLFSSNSSRNKQFWHIIVPSSVPINSLREVSTQSVQSGSSVLTHKGADYGLISEVQGQSAKKTLLLPSAQANEYKSAEVGISQTFNLQQLIPDRRHGSSVSKADSITKYEKPVRQQPEGLKMRYRPFGDTEDSSEQSGSESSSKLSVRAPKFRKPISIETSSSSKNMNQEESYVEMGGDTKSVKKGDRKRHGRPLGAAQSSHTEIERDYTVSPKVSKKRKGPPESENGDTERPVKKNKRKVSLESVPDARNSPFSSNAVHPEASEGSKESKIQKEDSHAEQNGIKTPRKSHKHKVPLESVLVAEARLLDEKPNGIRKRIKTQPSVEPVSTNGYPDDTIMLDPPLSTPPKRKNGETSQHGEHQNAKPDTISVRKETKQDDEIIAEPMEAKRKSKKEKRRRERSEGNVNMPAGEATRSAKKAKTTSPAAETLTDAPTMTIKPENTTTAKTPQPPGKEKKKHHRPEKKRSVSATTAPREPPATPSHPNTHSLGISNGKTPTPPAATPEQTKAPTAAAASAAASAAAAASRVLHHDGAPTSNPVHDRKKKRTEKKMKTSGRGVGIQS
ncbi:hypothetical protein MMC22_006027 [Lobaria immixta]|nr:hypothetical protein [Lobaria immixta]